MTARHPRSLPRRHRSWHRRLRHPGRWAVAAAVVALLLVLDLVTGLVAQHRVQAAVDRALPGAQVSAHVGGWPVTLHLAADQLGSVRLDARGVQLPAGGRDVDVDRFSATAHGVHGVRSGHRFRLDRVDGTVHLTWAELSRQTGADLGVAADGDVVLRGKVPVLGEQVDGRLTGRLVLDESTQQVHVDDPVASLDRVAVPSDVIEGLQARLSNRFTLPTVPGFTWTSVEPRGDGVDLTFRGNNLVFAA